MKRTIILLLIFIMGTVQSTMAQFENGDVVYAVPKSYPKYPGGEEELYRFLTTNIRIPDKAREQGIEGRVVVQFDIDTDGSIQNITIIEDIGGGCAEEVVRVITLMPQWAPALSWSNKTVKYPVMLPIVFSLPEENKNCAEQRKAAETESKEAMFLYAICLYEHDDYNEAIKWFIKAGNNGFAPAQLYLGNIYYYYGDDIVSKNTDSAIFWYSKASYGDDEFTIGNLTISSIAQTELGSIYSDMGDYINACKWYALAAKQNHNIAQSELGKTYLILNNLDSAEYWINEAKVHGVINNADTLAECFLKQKMYDKALYWLIIDLSNYEGIFRTHREYYIMGLQYEYGVDVERDIKIAKQWYEKATSVEEAQVAIERLKTKKNKRK